MRGIDPASVFVDIKRNQLTPLTARPSPTILDIAQAAGVSRTTASAALGGSGRISNATREHVRAVAARLEYAANPAARHLRTGRKGALGIYLAERLFGHAFYMDYVFGAAEVARESGFALTLITGLPNAPMSDATAHVDGVIIPDPIIGDPVVAWLLGSGLPVICAERHLDPGPQPRVTIVTDYEPVTRQLLDHLWERGARQPALLPASIEIAFIRMIADGYRDWCEKHGARPRIRYVEHGFDVEAALAQARALLDDPDPPDAILAAADGLALPVLDAARQFGYEVGADLLVASYVDSPALRLVTPGITAIEAPPREIGRDSARVLLELLRGEDVSAELHRPRPKLAIRESTAGRVRTHAT